VAKRMAALTPGFVGADIANICNEAAIVCARRNGPSVEMEDFERATERVIGGLPKSNNLMGAEARRTVALHESGHAVAGWYLEHSDPLLKVSVVPRSNGALGFAQYLPQEMALHSKEAILDKMCVALGGRAAEEIFVGKISTGASDDLSKVTQMAYSMVRVYGMNSELGLLSYSQDSQGQFYKPYSEETGRMIDQQARALVETQYERVKELLTSKSSVMTELADALQAKETLVYGDLRDIMGERPYQVKGQQLEYVTAGTKNPFTDNTAGPEQAAPGEAAADGPIPALQAKGEAMPK
jgi:AFG3 family protein